MSSAQKTAYLAVRRISGSLGSSPLKTYEFSVFAEKPLVDKAQGAGEGPIIAVKKVPKIYGKLLCGAKRNSGERRLGEIQWKLNGESASSFFYSPKTNSGGIGGLGYYLDLLSCNDLLKSFSIRYVCTHNPNDLRAGQMERVGNIPGEPNKIRIYMKNNAKAVRFKAAKFGRGIIEG